MAFAAFSASVLPTSDKPTSTHPQNLNQSFILAQNQISKTVLGHLAFGSNPSENELKLVKTNLPIVIVPLTFSVSEKDNSIFFQHVCSYSEVLWKISDFQQLQLHSFIDLCVCFEGGVFLEDKHLVQWKKIFHKKCKYSMILTREKTNRRRLYGIRAI